MCRASFIATSWSRRNRRNVSFSETVEEMANHIANNIGTAGDALDSSVKRKIHKEALMYMNKGNCQLRDEIHVCVNPTLLHLQELLKPIWSHLPRLANRNYLWPVVASKLRTSIQSK